jgi:protein SCO1/2
VIAARFAIVAMFVIGLVSTPRLAAAGVASSAIVDQRGDRFTLATLSARYVALTFVSSRCADSCPLSNALFAKLQDRIAKSHVSLALVTITLDPAYDTPAIMSRLAATFDANPTIWRFASGSPANVHRLMREFGVVSESDDTGIPDVHSSTVYVLDSERRVARDVALSGSLPEDVLAAIRRH